VSLESFGRSDRERAEADLFARLLRVLDREGSRAALHARFSDLAVFAALLDALALDAAARRQILRALAENRQEALLAEGTGAEGGNPPEPAGLARYPGVVEALKRADPAEARAFVSDLLALAGLSVSGSRSASEIAERFLDRAQAKTRGLGGEAAHIIRTYLAISGDPDSVLARLRAFARETGLDLNSVLDRFELRLAAMEAEGLMLDSLVADCAFSRNLEYYSGFVFEFRCEDSQARPVAAGGRYDALFSRLGANIPAVGAAIWVERLA
jgi:ATP phosphoribosyltransferase regulatory subunit